MITTSQPEADIYQGIDEATKFLAAMFPQTDTVSFRPIETWVEKDKKHSRVAYKLIMHCDRREPALRGVLTKLWRNAPELHLNLFYGVCPRFGGGGQYDQAWQIRIVRCIWVDIDNVSEDEARERVKRAGLPKPSHVVWSGNGVHIYWMLSEPYLIDDVGDPPPVLTEWVQVKVKNKSRKYILQDGEKLYLDRHKHLTKLSPKALHIQDVLAGVAKAVGGDATHDISRLLRLPGSLNRKDERNGKPAKECKLTVFRAEREYPLSTFEQFKCESPQSERARKIEKMPLPTIKRRPTAKVTDTINQRIAACDIAEAGTRSETDFALCCLAVRKGVAKENLWELVKETGKFKDEGERYFNLTWANAEYAVKLEKYEELAGKSMWEDEEKQSPPPRDDAAPGSPVIEVDASQTQIGQTLGEITQSLLDRSNCFSRAEQLVCIHDEKIRTVINSQELAGLLSEQIEFWFVEDRGGKYKTLPTNYATTWLNNRLQRERLPKVQIYVRNPVFNHDWQLVQPGFDKASGIYYAGMPIQPAGGLTHIDTLLRDFCFQSPADRTNYIGMMLTIVLMPHFIGSKPALMLCGTQPGLGKTVLAQILSILRDNSPAETVSYNPNDEEFEKHLGAVVRRGSTTIIIDNAKPGKRSSRIESPCLERSITDHMLSFRLLGQSATITAENSHIFCITANSPEVSRDIVTRSVVTNLYLEGDPTNRTFSIENPEGYALEHRTEILAELLGIVQRWNDAGRLMAKTNSRFNKRGWGNIVGGILQHAGLPEFLGNAEDVAVQLDATKADFLELVKLMFDDARMSWTATELAEFCKEQKLLVTELGDGNERSRATRFGKIALRYVDTTFRITDSQKVVFRRPDGRDGNVYRVFIDESAER